MPAVDRASAEVQGVDNGRGRMGCDSHGCWSHVLTPPTIGSVFVDVPIQLALRTSTSTRETVVRSAGLRCGVEGW